MPVGVLRMRYMFYAPGEKWLLAPLPHIESKDHSPEIFSKAFLSFMFLIPPSVCFVVLFT